MECKKGTNCGGDQVFTMFTLFVKFCSFSEVLSFHNTRQWLIFASIIINYKINFDLVDF